MGMGKDLCQTRPEARRVFEEANRILGFDISRLMFGGPEETLTRTANSQPAIFVMSCAAWEALKARAGFLQVRAFAGLSLGEYTALVAAGAISFAHGLRIVQKRAEYMEAACTAHPGTMASVIGLPIDAVQSACSAARRFGIVNVANANCPGQVVISGEKRAVEAAGRLAADRGAKRVIKLKVSGAFHSELMEEAERRLFADLQKADLSQASVPVVANVTATEETEPHTIRENLARQVTGTVLWQRSVELLLGRGVTTFVEVGCGRVLQSLVKRISPETVRMGVEDSASLETTAGGLQEKGFAHGR